MSIKTLQLNTARSTVAIDLACNYAATHDVDILTISEPNIKTVCKPGWVTDKSKDVAIKIINRLVDIGGFGLDNEGFAWVKVRGVAYYSCYISPNCEIGEFEGFLDRLQDSIKQGGVECIVGGDFNAKSTIWGNETDDRRGIILLDWIAGNNLILHNQGNEPTFRRGTSHSIIDLTLTSDNIATKISNWQVLEEESMSDHMYIYYEVNDDNKKRKKNREEITAGWKIDSKYMEIFVQHFKEGMKVRKNKNVQVTAENLVQECTTACNNSFLSKRETSRRQPAYWWNEEIANLRKTCLRYKRILVRSSRNKNLSLPQKESFKVEYKSHRKALKTAIHKSKQRAWSKICDEMDEDIWGIGYKIVMKKAHLYPRVKLDDARQLEIAKELFPRTETTPIRETIPPVCLLPSIDADELTTAISQIKSKKAAGPDRIPPEIVKVAALSESDTLLQVYNTLLQKGSFPRQWKTAQLVLIQKHDPTKFRPICLLDLFGKQFERVIANRLYYEVDGKLYKHQYGFRKGRSTTDAMHEVLKIVNSIKSKAPNNREFCVMATLDIRNAFNSAPWEEIMLALKDMGVSTYLRQIISDYLSERSVLIGRSMNMQMECEVPQGSILGPILWNIFYNSVLTIEVPTGTTIIGFADDTAVICKAKTQLELVSNTNWVLTKLSEEIRKKGLKLAAEKTEALILYGGRKFKNATLQLENETIETKPRLKYLGVVFDHNCEMKEHVKACCIKAEKSAVALSRIMPNLGGPKSSNRKTLANVAQSIILYAAPIWSEAIKWEKYRRLVVGVQRRMALRVCCGFRTISTEAALVLAGTPPIDLQIKKRCLQYQIAKGIESSNDWDLLNEWQRKWATETGKGAWTRILIPDLTKWVGRKHGEMNFYLCQLLSGHGWFNSYRNRFHLYDSDLCKKCMVVEDANHVFFHCEKWRLLIDAAHNAAGVTLTSQNCVEVMLTSQDSWNIVDTLVQSIVRERKKEDTDMR